MNFKNLFVLITFLCGVTLCVFSSAAFAALGVVVGTAAAAGGVYLIGWCRHLRRESIYGGAILIIVGLLLVILCLFVSAVAFFLGGIIMAAVGIILLLLFGRTDRMITPLSFGLLIMAALIIFMPAMSGWLTVIAGIGLLVYSGAALAYMH